jgi:uncharacterized membrane protein YccC
MKTIGVSLLAICLIGLALAPHAPRASEQGSGQGLLQDADLLDPTARQSLVQILAAYRDQIKSLHEAMKDQERQIKDLQQKQERTNTAFKEDIASLQALLKETRTSLAENRQQTNTQTNQLSRIMNGWFTIESKIGGLLDVESARLGHVIRLQGPGIQDNRLWQLKLQ